MKLARLIFALAAFCLAPLAAHSQTAVVTNPPVVANNCPSFTDIYGTAADSGIYCHGGILGILTSGHGFTAIPAYPTANDAEINIQPGGALYFSRASLFGSGTSATDVADVYFDRTAGFAGGTHGFVNGNVRVHDTVSAGVTSYEWPITCVLDNSSAAADASENVCGYFQAKKHGTGSTWAIVGELQDDLANPTAPSVTLEFDLGATGGDSNGMRVVQDNFCKSSNGAAATCAHGERIIADTNATITTGLQFKGAQGTAIDFSTATLGTAAATLGSGQKICFDATCQNTESATTGSGFSFLADSLTVGSFLLPSYFTVDGSGNGAFKGNLQIPAGKLLELGGNASQWITYDSGSGEHRIGNLVNGTVWKTDGAGNVTARTFTGSAGVTAGGPVTGTTATFSGNIKTTSGSLIAAAGNNLCLDGTCGSWLTYLSGTGQHAFGNVTNGNVWKVDGAGNEVARSGSFSAGVAVGGALTTATTGSFSGTVTAGAFSGPLTGNVTGTTTGQHNGNVCVDGAGCAVKVGNFSGSMTLTAGTGSATVSNGSLAVPNGGTFSVGTSIGVSCGAGSVSLSTLVVTGGVITHC